LLAGVLIQMPTKRASAHRFGVAPGRAPVEVARRPRLLIPEAPRSGVRLKSATEPLDSLRDLARRAERLGLEPLAFELFFAAARIESGRRVELVRSELAETAALVPRIEARFYRRAARSLAPAAWVD
jgi:hypothetical protein